MMLRELKTHFRSGTLQSAIGVMSPNNDGYYLMVHSNTWGIHGFLESDRKMKPRMFKTEYALLNAAKSIGFQYQSIEITNL